VVSVCGAGTEDPPAPVRDADGRRGLIGENCLGSSISSLIGKIAGTSLWVQVSRSRTSRESSSTRENGGAAAHLRRGAVDLQPGRGDDALQAGLLGDRRRTSAFLPSASATDSASRFRKLPCDLSIGWRLVREVDDDGQSQRAVPPESGLLATLSDDPQAPVDRFLGCREVAAGMQGGCEAVLG